ncbi:VCBS repeat-containing protein [Neobacillus sp. 179-C4.2 HS]|uniref:VCBS repeat-containing protein n=1 Tax=Neobacillus driksii TaxID=3035913 RepID=A0ABV4YTX6_9BACI|nr:VCBS repeat-containing protein [Neobacillus sp. 179.-C4.2 HS]MDP5193072.1 VCBS repeat-containing protein [Neobacillus sp. 179.-C4.2 HS]
MYRHFQEQAYGNYMNSRVVALLDMKQGDVTGDGIIDFVYLYGRKNIETEIFADQITLVIQDGRSNQISTINLQNNAGYNAKLFLGDFSKDDRLDILVSIESGGSGGYGIFYIYSFINNIPRLLFDFEKYNNSNTFKVNYKDLYKVNVESPSLDLLFILDISYKGYDYLSQLYDDNGKLKQSVLGEVLSAGALYPIVTNQKGMSYDLLVISRIIGISNSDTLGYVENLLTWNGTQFISTRLATAILGTKLSSLS